MQNKEVMLKTTHLKPHTLVAMKSKSPILPIRGRSTISVPGVHQDSSISWDMTVVQKTSYPDKQRVVSSTLKGYRILLLLLSRLLNPGALSQKSLVFFSFLLQRWESSQLKIWCLRNEGKTSNLRQGAPISPESCGDFHWIF